MTSPWTRMWGTVVRSAKAAQAALRAGGRVWPRRAVGAVQGPLEAPAEIVEVWGWAWLGRTEIAAVLVTLNGQVVGGASLGPPPPDVAPMRPRTRGSSRCGWRARVDLASAAGCSVTLGALAISHRGVVERLAPACVRVSRPIAGEIEIPAAGSKLNSGRNRVAGWALPFDQPLGRIDVRVDGHDAGQARPLAAPRPDIAVARDAPGAPLAGFEHFVTLTPGSGAPTRIDVDVVAIDGSRTSLVSVDTHVIEATVPFDTMPASPNGKDPDRSAIARCLSASARPLRLAVFTHRLDLGGAQLYLQELLRHFLGDGDLSLCLVVTEHDGPLRAELEALGAVVHLTEYPVRSQLAYESRLADLGRLVQAHGVEIAIVNTMGAGIGADVGQRLGIPTVWAVHESYRLEDFWPAAYGEGGFAHEVRASMLRALARTPAVVFVAEATRDVYASAGDDARLVTIPYGVPLDEIREFRGRVDRGSIRTEAGIPESATVLLCVATIEPRKAQATLASAFAEVAAEFPDTLLVLVGDNGGGYAAGLHEMVKRLEIADRIRLEPIVADPYPWFVAGDAFVLASDVESMPRALLEAMAFDLPVAAAGIWGVPELVADGVNGLVFPPRDVGAAAGVLRRLLRLPAEDRARLREAGASTVRERHDVRGYVDAYRRLLRGLASDPSALPAALLGS